MDKDCRLDGSEDALAILTSIAPKSAEVTTCGCLGPCGGGPNVEVKDEMGKRIKDGRPGKSSYYLFKDVNSASEAASLLSFVTDSPVKGDRSPLQTVTSTRGPLDLDRTTKIALQRLIYVVTALFLKSSQEAGTFDMIGGEVVENSYFAGAAGVFIASQFMGTGSKDNIIK
ncbi:hypothetical protein TrST_g13529 [Triparma strigata]|uniref:Uncharacterized protein n=1 Tax=Triparma strigata TaxID=1606541 RepID=A0A9W7AHI9_9STRA|nr:hypothetical protein TrST_g13529 [Triparma strigata]